MGLSLADVWLFNPFSQTKIRYGHVIGFASWTFCRSYFAVQLHVPSLRPPRPKLSQHSCGAACGISLPKGIATPMPGERVCFHKGCNFENFENGCIPTHFKVFRFAYTTAGRATTLNTLKIVETARISKFSEFRVLPLVARQL